MQHSKSNSSSTSSTISAAPQRIEDEVMYASLIHPMVEAGLVLAEYVGKDKGRNAALELHLAKTCSRYVVVVAEVMMPLLDAEVLNRLKVHLY